MAEVLRLEETKPGEELAQAFPGTTGPAVSGSASLIFLSKPLDHKG
jgi:hypothetical protein